MAFNLQTFRTRTLTSVAFVLIMLCGLLINYLSFFLLFSIIHFGCWLEYIKLAGEINPGYKKLLFIHKLIAMLAGFGFMLWMTKNVYDLDEITVSEIGWYIFIASLVALPLTEILAARRFSLNYSFISIIGLIYISFSCGCMISLRTEGMIFGNFFGIDLGIVLPLLLIATIWVNDTMAYIIGSLIGKTPLTSISPKKTWEGTIGGVLLAITVITICGYFIFKADVLQLIIITAITCVAGIFGDLFESKLKRMAGVKDSGHIMPGHGGFLDRFDSLLLATIFVWIYVKLIL